MDRRLVTGGESLKVWDVNDNYSSVYNYTPLGPLGSGNSVNCTSWSFDGSCLASSVSNSDKILMTYSKNKILTTTEIASGFSTPLSAVLFPASRLATSAAAGKSLWISSGNLIRKLEIGKSKFRKEFSIAGSDVITCLALNSKDEYLAAGTGNGIIKLFHVARSSETTLMKGGNECLITGIRYNNFKGAMLGSTSDNGNVSFWDTNANKRLQSFSCHSGPCRGLAFSTVNEMLVLSSGLDKKCVCYDTKEKKSVSTIKTEYPLTKVDFHQDGFMLALGTTQGKVLIYDLRSYTSPIKTVEAHNGSVNYVRFSPILNSVTMTSRLSSKKASTTSLSSQLRAQVSKNNLMKENLPSPVTTPKGGGDKDDSVSSTLFSPLKNEFTSSPVISEVSDVGRSGNFSNGSLFSPLRENSLINNSSNRSLMTSFDRSNNSGTTLFSPLSSIREEIHQHAQQTSSMSPIKEIQRKIADTVISEPLPKSNISDIRLKPNDSDSELDSVFNDDKDLTNIKAVMTAFPSVVTSKSSMSNDKDLTNINENTTIPTVKNITSEGGDFQQAFIQSVVKESMEEFTFDMRKQLWTIQYDLIRSMQSQTDDIKEMMEAYSPNEKLMREIEKLKAENHLLKTSF